jgi:hypothetical protein
VSPTVDLLPLIKRHLRGLHRVSLSRLSRLCGLTQRQLVVALQARAVAHWMRKRGWSITDSKALGLPPLEHPPYSLPYLVRNAPQPEH